MWSIIIGLIMLHNDGKALRKLRPAKRRTQRCNLLADLVDDISAVTLVFVGDRKGKVLRKIARFAPAGADGDVAEDVYVAIGGAAARHGAPAMKAARFAKAVFDHNIALGVDVAPFTVLFHRGTAL